MDVILRSDIPKLGKAFDVVKVKDGYARNYLLPKKLAVKATKASLEHIEKEKETKKTQEDKNKRVLKELCDKISGKSYTIPVATNEEEKLYAGVSKQDILEAMKLEGADIAEDNLILAQPVKELGIYEIDVRFKYDISTKIKIWVVKK